MNVEKLKEAKRLVTEVRENLNTSCHQCECCGHVIYEDWDDHQTKDTLNAVLHRLEKTIQKFSEKLRTS